MNASKYLEPITEEKTAQVTKIEFATGNTLFVDKTASKIQLINGSNLVQLTIHITENGQLVADVNAAELNITATEQINIASKKINLHAQEQINIASEGNFIQTIEKDSLTETGGINKNIAQTQKITAALGNVDIKANDYIKLNGESVLLNCD